jgi:transposase
VHIRTSCKDQVHAVLAKLGVTVTCTDIFGAWGSTWLDELRPPQPYAGKIASLRKLTGELTAEITLLDTVIGDLLEHHQAYHALQQLPGIGRVLAAVIVAEIGDISRFHHPGQLCACMACKRPGVRVPLARQVRSINRKPEQRVRQKSTAIAVNDAAVHQFGCGHSDPSH